MKLLKELSQEDKRSAQFRVGSLVGKKKGKSLKGYYSGQTEEGEEIRHRLQTT